MKLSFFRFMILAAVCGMLAVSLSSTSAVAENGSDIYEVENYCPADTLDANTTTSDEALFTSDIPEEDVVPSSCYACITDEDCWLTPYTKDGYCRSYGGGLNCCYFY